MSKRRLNSFAPLLVVLILATLPAWSLGISLYEDNFNRAASSDLGTTSGGNLPWVEVALGTERTSITNTPEYSALLISGPGGYGNAYVNYDLDPVVSYRVDFDLWIDSGLGTPPLFLVYPRIGAEDGMWANCWSFQTGDVAVPETGQKNIAIMYGGGGVPGTALTGQWNHVRMDIENNVVTMYYGSVIDTRVVAGTARDSVADVFRIGYYWAGDYGIPNWQVDNFRVTPLSNQNRSFTVPASRTITPNGSLSDWSDGTDWSTPFTTWYGGGLSSTTRAKFSWNKAANLLYVAMQTNQANGGHAVVGFSKNYEANPSTGIGSTQLCFDPIANSNNVLIRNEIQYYKDNGGPSWWAGGGIEGVQAGYSYDNDTGIYTYEIAIPLWTDWTTMTEQQTLNEGDQVYVYCVMESALGSAIGTDMTYTGNPMFYLGAFSAGSTLTLAPGTAVQIPGDANDDGKVDVSDLGILAANYGTTSGATWATGDFNGDHAVDVSDLGILAANYGTGSGAAFDFNADAKTLGLSTDAKEEAAAVSSLGCGSAGLPLLAGLLLMGTLLIKLEE